MREYVPPCPLGNPAKSPNLAVAPVQPPSLHLDLRPRRPARPPSIWKKCYLDSSQPESGRYGLVVTLFWN